jgi:peptide-methionine (S)-S-oxide reductase
MQNSEKQLVTFASGCFWCTEAVFKRVKGVLGVVSGYMGGSVDQPSYDQVSNGESGHAEAIQFEFDPKIVDYKKLVEIFFGTHNPTTLNQQGNDVGEQYRSVIFFHNENQKQIAESVKQRLDQEKVFDNPIVTDIMPAQQFYPAEAEHQDYYSRNSDQPYCQAVINPKLAKLRNKYAEFLN